MARVLSGVLIAVYLVGILFGAHPASAQESSGFTAQSPVGTSITESPHRIYLPSVFRNYPERTSIFGVQMYGNLDSPTARLDLAQQADVSWIRWPIHWRNIEPWNTTPDKYSWISTDASLIKATQDGAKIIMTIEGNPSWAATYFGGPIDLAPLSEFVQFVQAVVERYDGDGYNDAPGSPVVEHFEFYNEPDAVGLSSGRWGDHGTEYAQMLCAVAPAIKVANKKAKILMGGLAYDYFQEEYGPFVREFLDDVLAAGGGQCMDYMVFHYYPFFEYRWSAYGPGLSGKAVFLRSKLAQYGVGHLPMMVTEAGFHSDPYPPWPSTERIQASYVVKLFAQAVASDIKAVTWWSWTDLPDYCCANGLLTLNLQPKEAYFAFRVAVSRLNLNAYQRTVSASELGNTVVEAYLFHAARPLYVLWTNNGAVSQVALPGKTVHVRDLLDNSLGVISDASDGQVDGRVHLKISPTPIYVEIFE